MVVLPPWESIRWVAGEIEREREERGGEIEKEREREKGKDRYRGKRERGRGTQLFRDLDGASGDSKA